jgi:hypothetical protein
MSSKKGLGRLYDRLTPEERFRLDVLAMARGDEEESERLTATCPRRGYTMYDWGFVGRWEAARELAMFAYVDVVRRLDKIKAIAAFCSVFPYLSTIWQDDVHWAYFDGHKAGSRPRLEQEWQSRRAARLGSRRGGGGAQRRPHNRRGLPEVDG